jgi:NTP pyrophosphatase (non-canonical NTP hydrolase)
MLTGEKREVKKYSREWAWEQFHNPTNPGMALTVEAFEILEVFQWKKTDEGLRKEELIALENEIGNVFFRSACPVC